MSSFSLSLAFASVMSSTGSGFLPVYTISGRVRDDEGNMVGGADVHIRSAVDDRRIVSSGDGGFFSDICVGGAFDRIRIDAFHGRKRDRKLICATGSHFSVDIILH